MPTNRYHNLDAERRDALMQSAVAEFAARGYEGAALTRIGGGADMSKGVLYYYFEDKTDLYVETLRYALARIGEAVGMPAPAALAGDFWGQLRQLLKRTLAYAADNPWVVQLAKSFYQLPARAANSRELQSFYDQDLRMITEFLEVGRNEGVVRNDAPLELLARVQMAVAQAADAWVLLRWSEYAHDPDATTDLYLDLFRRICMPLNDA